LTLLLDDFLLLVGSDFALLQLVADQSATGSAEGAANCRTRSRIANRGPNDRAGGRAEAGANECSFFALAERL
jgi:hypothetical protein